MSTHNTTNMIAKLIMAGSLFSMSFFAISANETYQWFKQGYPTTQEGYFTSYYELDWHQEAYITTTSYTASSVSMDSAATNSVAGRGWETGKQWRTVNFQIKNYKPAKRNQKIVFALYGWTKSNNNNYDGMAEYYIIENYNDWKPEYQNDEGNDSGARWLGSQTVNGAKYDYYVSTRTDKPHAFGGDLTTFKQYWAVRTWGKRRNSGAINTGKHFQMWTNPQEYKHEKYPYRGKWGYQIFAVESYKVGGTVDLNAWSSN